MKFWDSSAILPLLVSESSTPTIQAILREDPELLVWWATEIECVSAIARLERDGDLSREQVGDALERLGEAVAGWAEVQPVEAVRRTARRLLRVHRLRAADALQLAAASVSSEGDPSTLELVTLDDRLRDAASREGFVVRDATVRGAPPD